MDSNCALFSLTRVQELFYNVIFWCGTIQEVEVEMLDTSLGELLGIVLRFIQSYN